MLRNYTKTAFKVFLRRKFFTAVSLFGITFTLVVLMVVAAGLDYLFGPYPPEVRTDRTLGVYMIHHEEARGDNDQHVSQSGPSYSFLDRYVRTLTDVEAVSVSMAACEPVISYQSGDRVELKVKRTDGAFWRILDFDFLEGGPYTDQDDDGRRLVAVINESTKRRLFGDAPGVGRSIALGPQPFAVVGVVADVPALRLTPYADVWVPIHTSRSTDYLDRRKLIGQFQALILARDPDDLPRIRQEFQSRLADVEFPDPGATNTLHVAAETLFEMMSRILVSRDLEESRPNLLLVAIAAAMVLFMVLPTLNLINLNLSRVLERSSEIGVRKAFGASSWTVVGQLVTENVLLTLIGGVLGFLLSAVVLHQIGDSGLVPYAEFRLNYRIFLYGLLTALFFGVFSGAYPAWRMSRLHPVQALRGGER